MFLVTAIFAIFASTFIIGQGALIYTSPIFLIAVRMILGGSLLLGYIFFFQKSKLTKINFSLLAQLSIFHIFIPYVTEFWGLQYVGGAKTAMLYSVSPFITAIFDRFLFNVKLSARKKIALIIGISGLIPVIISHNSQEICFQNLICNWGLPELAVLVSAISSCYGWLLLKRAIIQHHYSPFYANGIAMLSGGLLALITSGIFEYWSPLPSSNFKLTLFFVALLILVGNFLYYNAYGFLLKRYSATFLSFFGFTIPLFAAFYQWIFFGQAVGLGFVITFGLTFFGLLLFYLDGTSASRPDGL